MIIGDKFIYFELQKTGGTFVSVVLLDNEFIKVRKLGKHNRYTELDDDILTDFEHWKKIGNIRNPWEWYVSLWAFGCTRKGSIYSHMAKKPKLYKQSGIIRALKDPLSMVRDTHAVNKLYEDVNNIENFRIWVNLILEPSQISMGIEYKKSKFSKFAGLMSFRYLNLYCLYSPKAISSLSSYEQLLEYDSKNNFMNHVIRLENINSEMLKISHVFGLKKEEMAIQLKKHAKPLNKSKHLEYNEYYTEKLKELVMIREKFIIHKYKYVF